MTDINIPKIIHYCWFGGNPLPELAQKCIASWKNFCPDYEIKEWNESNYNVRKIPYISQAYDAKKYAFVSDYARFDILYEYGGIYLDTDVELIKPLDELLKHGAFCGVEQPGALNAGLGMAAPAEMPIFREILDSYQSDQFINADKTYNLKTVVVRVSDIFKKYGFSNNEEIQEVAWFRIYPKEYFCPKDIISGEVNITDNTYSIHHFDASWIDEGFMLIKKDRLDLLGFILNADEKPIYYDLLSNKNTIKNRNELYIAVNMIENIYIAGKNHYNNPGFYKTIKDILFSISEYGIRNKTTSLKLYFTTFRKWKIFKTPRANLRYIYHCFRNFLNAKIDGFISKLRKYHKKFRQFRLKNKNFSLIASNCNGAMILHDLNMRFNSPFVDLWIKPQDFIKMCQNLSDYMNSDLQFTSEKGIDYPVGILKDIKIYFQHYNSNKAAEDKWNKRKERINYENIFILFTDRDGCTKQDLIDFDNLKYKNKAVFVHKPMPDISSAVYIRGFEQNDSVGMCMNYRGRFSMKRHYEDFDYVSWFNKGIN